jgi:HK97 family phage portal protein
MTFLQRILGGEKRSLEDPNVLLTPAEIQGIFAQPNVDSGMSVTEKTALNEATVWRCVNILANGAASVPLKAFVEGSYEPMVSSLLKEPNPDLTPFEYWRLTYVHRLLWGNHYSEKVYDGSGRIRALLPIDPATVTVGRKNGNKMFRVLRGNGTQVDLTSDEVFHLPGLNYDGLCGISVIQKASQGIGLSMAAERFGAQMFGRGTHLSGVLHTDKSLTEQQADAIKGRWRAKMTGPGAAHDIAVLDNGADFTPISMPNTDAQFVESRDFQTNEICRWFGVPPHMVGNVDRTTSWGTGIEQQTIGFITFTLGPDWLAPTEQRVTKELLRDPKIYARYSVEEILRGDSVARSGFYQTMRNIGAFSVNDILEMERRPPVEGGDTRIQPLNMTKLGDPTASDSQENA